MPRRRSLLRGLFIWLARVLSPRPHDRPAGSGRGPERQPGDEMVTTPLAHDVDDAPLSRDLSANVERMEKAWHHAADLVVRRFGISGGPRAALVFLKGQVDDARLDLSVVRPLQRVPLDGKDKAPMDRLVEHLEERAVHTVHLEVLSSFADAVDRVAHGYAVLLVDGEAEALAINVYTRPHRAVEEPGTEQVVRGPREGFVEDLDTNLALMRTRVRHPALRFLAYRFGRYSQTRVRVLYLDGRTPPALVEEVRQRLERIEIDAIIESSYIEELIEDAPYSPFPQMLPTERPDVAAAALYEGRVVILTDGSPFALIAPVTFWSLLQASEDYYQRHLLSSFLRLLRVVLIISSVTLPALYIAAVIFHHGMLPTPLLITIAASRERVPLPAALEIFLFEVAFEAFREAGVRLPRSVGQTVGIVGGIIIGQAAVQAGLISAPVIVVIALTGLASFATPHAGLAGSMRILRFFLILMAASFGLYGILIGGGLIQVHLLALRSFGIPYLWPLSPLDLRSLKDILVRWPIWGLWSAPRPEPETADRADGAGAGGGTDPGTAAGPGSGETGSPSGAQPRRIGTPLRPQPPPGPRETRGPVRGAGRRR